MNLYQTTAEGVFPDLTAFEEVLDARSPAEFALDSIPGAVNRPVLNDEERAQVGLLHAEVGAFAARRLGAGLVSANIARHFAVHFYDKPRSYAPLIYCWRGGQRSASLATVLAAVGWRVTVLRGGYKTYRSHVQQQLHLLPQHYTYQIIGGATGSGKTRLLHHLAARGAQVLDLEELAHHRGSALGHIGPQPSQKRFETRLWHLLKQLDPARPVWLEAESNRIGDLYIPEALWAKMKAARGIELQVPVPGRVAHLLQEYPQWQAEPAALVAVLRRFIRTHGPRQVQAWEAQIAAGDWPAFVASVLQVHYDRRYEASAHKCFPQVTQVEDLPDATEPSLAALAERLTASAGH